MTDEYDTANVRYCLYCNSWMRFADPSDPDACTGRSKHPSICAQKGGRPVTRKRSLIPVTPRELRFLRRAVSGTFSFKGPGNYREGVGSGDLASIAATLYQAEGGLWPDKQGISPNSKVDELSEDAAKAALKEALAVLHAAQFGAEVWVKLSEYTSDLELRCPICQEEGSHDTECQLGRFLARFEKPKEEDND